MVGLWPQELKSLELASESHPQAAGKHPCTGEVKLAGAHRQVSSFYKVM